MGHKGLNCWLLHLARNLSTRTTRQRQLRVTQQHLYVIHKQLQENQQQLQETQQRLHDARIVTVLAKANADTARATAAAAQASEERAEGECAQFSLDPMGRVAAERAELRRGLDANVDEAIEGAQAAL